MSLYNYFIDFKNYRANILKVSLYRDLIIILRFIKSLILLSSYFIRRYNVVNLILYRRYKI